MKKCWFYKCVSMILVLLFSSCSLDLDPAKSGSTEVSFSVGDALKGRAIAPGTGYLYIRTVGGPTGDNGPFYGPYQLSASSVFTTTDIPAGSYDGFGILYATEPLEERIGTYNNMEQSFTELMNLPDNDFIVFTEDNGNSEFDSMINGYASGTFIQNVMIRMNSVNVLSALLEPITLNSGQVMSNTFSFLTDTTENPNRKFYEIDISYEALFQNGCFSMNVLPTEGEMYNAILYDKQGIPVTVLPANTTMYFSNRYDTLYLYLHAASNAEIQVDLNGGV